MRRRDRSLLTLILLIVLLVYIPIDYSVMGIIIIGYLGYKVVSAFKRKSDEYRQERREFEEWRRSR